MSIETIRFNMYDVPLDLSHVELLNFVLIRPRVGLPGPLPHHHHPPPPRRRRRQCPAISGRSSGATITLSDRRAPISGRSSGATVTCPQCMRKELRPECLYRVKGLRQKRLDH